jgi:hypothetical protein
MMAFKQVKQPYFKQKFIPFSRTDGVSSIEFNPDNAPVRKVVSRSNARATGKWPSWKSGRMMHYDSPHECTAFKLLDATPEVISYFPQPCTIYYTLDGERYRHIPDILVNYSDSMALWEVKTAIDADRPEVERRTALMVQELPKFGYNYQLMIAEDMQRGSKLKNVLHLIKHGRKPLSLFEMEQIRQLFKKAGAIPWGFFQHGEPGAVFLKQVCRLLLEGVLMMDIQDRWDASTKVYMHHIQLGDSSWV